jgi:phospholipid/cholesterol/gamma-HCH transport system substrate-binding protein
MSRKSSQAIGAPLTKSIIFLIATVAVLILIAIELAGGGLFQDRASYSAIFTDASGIKDGQTVRIDGVQADIRYLNLTGDRYLELKQGAGAPGNLPEGATIPITQTAPALDLNVLLAGFSPLFQGLDPGQINDLSNDLVNVLQGEGGTVDSLLQRTASLTNGLADKDALIGDTVNNLNSVLTTLDQRGPQVSDTVNNLDKLVKGLSDQRGRLGDSLQQTTNLVGGVNTLLTRVRGPLNDAVPQIDRLSTLVNQGSGDVNTFLRDLPGGYLRISRLGSRGSTYNLFICALRVKVTGPDGKPMVFPTPDMPGSSHGYFGPNPNTERCKANDSPRGDQFPIDDRHPLETPQERDAKGVGK